MMVYEKRFFDLSTINKLIEANDILRILDANEKAMLRAVLKNIKAAVTRLNLQGPRMVSGWYLTIWLCSPSTVFLTNSLMR